MKIMVMGDIHANWGRLNVIMNKKSPDMILQCGDFGFWPHHKQFSLDQIKNIRELKDENDKVVETKTTTVHWCDGNHEDFWSLKDRPSNEIKDKVFYQPRGSSITLPDGRIVLFVGGAYSIDKHSRTEGVDWFSEEEPSYVDFENIYNLNHKVDIVISHTCPNEFDMIGSPYFRGKVIDSTRNLLSVVLEKFKPSLWYFGHWHDYKVGKYNDCYWTCLDMIDGDKKGYTNLLE